MRQATPRVYNLRDAAGERRSPTLREALQQYASSANFFRDRRCLQRGVHEIFHLATFLALIAFLALGLTWWSALALVGSAIALGVVVNTIWYHRYCSHHAFRFASGIYPRLFLWLNPLGIREELYALIHHIHHDVADRDEDPYGPHLGAVASYLVSEWHNNHHLYRSSANTGFLPGQLDYAFLMLEAMHRLGIVDKYNDHRPQFIQAYLRPAPAELARSA